MDVTTTPSYWQINALSKITTSRNFKSVLCQKTKLFYKFISVPNLASDKIFAITERMSLSMPKWELILSHLASESLGVPGET